MRVELPRRHDAGHVGRLKRQLGAKRWIVVDPKRRPGSAVPWHAPSFDKSPKLCAANRVDDEMDALIVIGVDNAVRTPCVEDPTLACRHMNRGVAAFKADTGLGDDGRMHADAIRPIIAEIGVARDFRLSSKAHQARAPGDNAHRCNNLLQVWRALQVRCRLHHAAERLVGRIAVHGDQGQHRISREFLRMKHPGAFRHAGNLVGQALCVERQRQLDERMRELHGNIVVTAASAGKLAPDVRPSCSRRRGARKREP